MMKKQKALVAVFAAVILSGLAGCGSTMPRYNNAAQVVPLGVAVEPSPLSPQDQRDVEWSKRVRPTSVPANATGERYENEHRRFVCRPQHYGYGQGYVECRPYLDSGSGYDFVEPLGGVQ